MMRLGDLITRQSKLLLEKKQYAIVCAVLFSVMPFLSWLSVSLVALVTLRKGAKCGFEVLLPAVVMHSVPLLLLVPFGFALLNTVIAYLPCYFAALVLRRTASWQLVLGAFLLQACFILLLISVFFPDFASDQLSQLKVMLAQYPVYQTLADTHSEGLVVSVLSPLFLGFQILGIIVSSVVSLMFSRAMQAKLFLSGGFVKEVSAFRCGKLSFFILVLVSLAAYYNMSLGISLLPILLTYFLISGYNLAYFILAKKRQVSVAILLLLIIFLKPTFILLAYIVFGSLDSLINFRMYLPTVVRESI